MEGGSSKLVASGRKGAARDNKNLDWEGSKGGKGVAEGVEPHKRRDREREQRQDPVPASYELYLDKVRIVSRQDGHVSWFPLGFGLVLLVLCRQATGLQEDSHKEGMFRGAPRVVLIGGI